MKNVGNRVGDISQDILGGKGWGLSYGRVREVR